MGEITKVVGQWIANNVPWTILIGVFVFSLLFEISKIKIYPLSWLWKLISWPFKKIDEQRTSSFKNLVAELKSDIDAKLGAMSVESASNCNAVKSRFDELVKRFDKLDDKQVETEERLDALAAARIKNHVLSFARQCRKGELHSHEDFANLFNENKEYQKLVKKYGWENDVYKHDFAYIQRVYDNCNNKGDFVE